MKKNILTWVQQNGLDVIDPNKKQKIQGKGNSLPPICCTWEEVHKVNNGNGNANGHDK